MVVWNLFKTRTAYFAQNMLGIFASIMVGINLTGNDSHERIKQLFV